MHIRQQTNPYETYPSSKDLTFTIKDLETKITKITIISKKVIIVIIILKKATKTLIFNKSIIIK